MFYSVGLHQEMRLSCCDHGFMNFYEFMNFFTYSLHLALEEFQSPLVPQNFFFQFLHLTKTRWKHLPLAHFLRMFYQLRNGRFQSGTVRSGELVFHHVEFHPFDAALEFSKLRV